MITAQRAHELLGRYQSLTAGEVQQLQEWTEANIVLPANASITPAPFPVRPPQPPPVAPPPRKVSEMTVDEHAELLRKNSLLGGLEDGFTIVFKCLAFFAAILIPVILLLGVVCWVWNNGFHLP